MLVQGSIVWAEVFDPRGRALKERPLVVISHADEIVLDAEFVAAAITTSFPDPAPAGFVELPWSRPRHPATGLARRSAVACRWLVRLRRSQIIQVRGYVPQKHLLLILQTIRSLNEPDGTA